MSFVFDWKKSPIESDADAADALYRLYRADSVSVRRLQTSRIGTNFEAKMNFVIFNFCFVSVSLLLIHPNFAAADLECVHADVDECRVTN